MLGTQSAIEFILVLILLCLPLSKPPVAREISSLEKCASLKDPTSYLGKWPSKLSTALSSYLRMSLVFSSITANWMPKVPEPPI